MPVSLPPPTSRFSWLLLLCLAPVFAGAQPVWDMAKLGVAPKTYPAEAFKSASPEIRPLFYEGLPYHGKPTRVFAWLGMPKVAPGTKVPGIVLVHGGGGTAFQTWVKLWTARGYAAISMDNCGALPEPQTKPRPRHEFSGPPGWGGFDQIKEAPEDQWTYHAVADALLAHSLLRAQPGVDTSRIGLTGISWGGFLTCTIAGVDDRFCFAVPVYGCGFYLETHFGDNVRATAPDKGERWMHLWDPSHYLPQCKVPTLWVTGSNDFAYWFPPLQKTYRLVPEDHRTLAIRLRMPHGHGPAGEGPKEIAVFADSIVKGGDPLAKVISQQVKDSTLSVSFASKHPIVKAELNVTADNTSPWPKREWKALPATVNGTTVSATLPPDTKVYYMNLFDDRDCVVSSEHVEIAP